MKYNEFMKAVDERLSVMTETEKTAWIHNLARTAKEQQRSAFLDSLKESRAEEQAGYQAIQAQKEAENWCRKIEAEEIYFERSGYEEYGQNYWDNDYGYEYTDAFNIGKNLYGAFQMAKDLLLQKEYEQASVWYDRLCRMRVPVLDSDTGEWDELEELGGYRNSYYKAAMLITALGETMESNGKLGGKAMMIEHYKKMYSRKRAFKAEFA